MLSELGFGELTLVGVAKGPDRKPGQERLFVYGASTPLTPAAHGPASRLIQRIRDEAHRFAITGHRRKRARRYNESMLEVVPGLGPAKRTRAAEAFRRPAGRHARRSRGSHAGVRNRRGARANSL